MATEPGSHKDRIKRQADKKTAADNPQPSEWKEALRIVLILMGLVALVALLASMEAESAGGSDLQYWMQ